MHTKKTLFLGHELEVQVKEDSSKEGLHPWKCQLSLIIFSRAGDYQAEKTNIFGSLRF
tara:strand:+ start:226 stop:399 length:174 start_codon:yes stop_codon:yes gene_type:complete